jgi:DNA-directed RNA polymerase subunit RPC12/RpoP
MERRRRTLAAYPRLVIELHPTKNGALSPRAISYGSIRKIWWRCARGHEWQDTANHRTTGRRGCPYCAGRRVTKESSLRTTYPDVARQWDAEKNGDLTPRDVTAGSDRTVWWRCPRGADHAWRCKIEERTRGRGCPFCAGRRASITNSLASRAPELAREWHPKKNGKLTPLTVVAGSERKVWWRCRRGHEWQATVAGRAVAGRNCPMCAGQVVTRETSLGARAPGALRFWHPTKNRPLTPWSVAPHTSRKAWWRCPKGADHVWLGPIATQGASGGRCPYCSHRRLSSTNCLATRYPKVAKQWHPTLNGKVTPKDILGAVSRKFWWRCEVGHAWLALVSNRTRLGAGCPVCSGRERKAKKRYLK